jgi:hypothetical protein
VQANRVEGMYYSLLLFLSYMNPNLNSHHIPNLGNLAVSRAFGDFEFKERGRDPKTTKVTALPDIEIHSRDSGDDLLVCILFYIVLLYCIVLYCILICCAMLLHCVLTVIFASYTVKSVNRL